MQNFRTRNKKYIEDNFDLDSFKEEAQKKYYRKKYQKTKKSIAYINVLIGIFSIAIALLMYELSNYYISLWRDKNVVKGADAIIKDIELDPAGGQLPVFDPEKPEFIPKEEEPSATEIAAQNDGPRKASPEFAPSISQYNNDDIVGLLKIDGTRINDLVAKGDDLEFYLTHGLDKEPNVAGSVFMDNDNSVMYLSDNTILYGHNMKDGSKFHDIRNYNLEGEHYLDTHKYINLVTLYDNTLWEIFSFYSTDISFNYLETNFNSAEEKEAFIREIRSRSFYVDDMEVTTDDKILTLSTCTNQEEDTRYVVHAKLISIEPMVK
ncbi:MAG: class B sortase [Clostridiales bacterium]|jgi:sortase B|nr:class B sortase [Clostridiales bacterium]